MAKTKKSRDQLIRDLAALLEETGLSEIEIEDEDLRVRVTRGAPQPTVDTVSAKAAAPEESRAASARESVETAPSPAEERHPGTVSSPMVGTVFLAPEPGAEPFVKVGATVEEGETLMIIEAMKVMNPLPAPRGGKIKEILVTDAQPVEFDEPLLIIE